VPLCCSILRTVTLIVSPNPQLAVSAVSDYCLVHTPVSRNNRSWQLVVDEKAYSRSVPVRIASRIRDAQVILCIIKLDRLRKDLR
jgi:hypothetical protein